MTFSASMAADVAQLNKDLAYQIVFGTDDKVLQLIEQGAVATGHNQENVPFISLAATRKSDEGLDILKALMASGVPVDQLDGNGQTALFYAARVGNLDAVKLLLESGADYYLQDKKGNIARNAAYERGYMDVFSYMDSFIDNKRNAAIEEYKRRDREIQEAEAKALAQIEAAKQAQLEAEAEAKELEATKEKIIQDAEEEKKRLAEESKPKPKLAPEKTYREMNTEEFNTLLHDLSYNACAMQYWYHVKGSRIKTDFTMGELNKKIRHHSNETKRLTREVRKYGAKKRYINRIVRPSKNRIYKILEDYGSNITRKSKGVGEEADANKRCGEIADEWLVGL